MNICLNKFTTQNIDRCSFSLKLLSLKVGVHNKLCLVQIKIDPSCVNGKNVKLTSVCYCRADCKICESAWQTILYIFF